MSDEKKVEPAKTRAVNVEELKKQVDGLAAYVRKIVKRLEELGGIDINMDGKVGLIIISLMLLSGVVLAADTQVSGYTNETNVGTFYVSTDGTDSTLTVDKLSVLDATTLPGGYVSNVTAQTATLTASVTQSTAALSATAVIQGVTYSVIDDQGATNSMVSPTNIVITILNGDAVVTNVTATVAGVTTNVAVTRK
jgi:hypothetical protein